MDKQLNSIYFSATDCTSKIIKEISKGISNVVKEYDITMQISRQNKITFNSNDLVIFGVPVYAGRVPSFLINYFAKIKGKNTKAIFIVVYGNRDYDDALLELKETLEKNGFIGIAAGAFIGEHSKTTKVATRRPDINDLNTAIKFGMNIKDKLNNADNSNLTKFVVKGNFPYKIKLSTPTTAPVTSDNCIRCGICAKYCPMSSIDFKNFADIDSSKCIRCCSCVKRCPVKAKSINDETFNKTKQHLINNFSSIRKEPELFI